MEKWEKKALFQKKRKETTTAFRRKSAWGKIGEEANTILSVAEEFEMAFR